MGIQNSMAKKELKVDMTKLSRKFQGTIEFKVSRPTRTYTKLI